MESYKIGRRTYKWWRKFIAGCNGKKTIPYYTGVIKLAQWLGKPTFIYAQGLGPVHSRAMFPFIKSAMKKSRYISVRDEQSAQLLRNIGVVKQPIEVVPDPVMGMPLPDQQTSWTIITQDKPVIGVSVRFWRSDHQELAAIAEALIKLINKRSVHIAFYRSTRLMMLKHHVMCIYHRTSSK